MENRSRYYYFTLILFTITACSQIKTTPFPTVTAPVTIPPPTHTKEVTIPQPTHTLIPSNQAYTSTATNSAMPIPTTRRYDSRWYGLDIPIANNTYTSPVRFSGSTNMTPENFTIYVTLLNDEALVLAQVPVTIQGEVNQPGTFSGMIFFWDYDGPGWVTIREQPEGMDIDTAAVTFQSNSP